jgi:hypothetical protein
VHQVGAVSLPRKLRRLILTTTRTLEERLGTQLASFMRQRAAFGITFAFGVIAIDIEHIRKCGRPGNALLETLTTAAHEFAHFSHPRWTEQKITRWWKKTVEPQRELLVEFARAVDQRWRPILYSRNREALGKFETGMK